MEQDILVFEVDDRQFGLPAEVVIEVVRAVTPMSVPRSPEVIKGIINLRGQVVPVLDIRALLRMNSVDVRHTDHLIIVQDGRLNCAIHTDRAIDLVSLDDETENVDKVSSGDRLIRNTAMGLVQIIRPSELLSKEERAALEAIVASTPLDKPTP